MTYKLTKFGQSRLPLTGVAWRDLSDEEYAAALARHPGMEDHGYFVKEDEPEVIEEAPRGRRKAVTEEETDG